uniref:Cysteine proteinase CG12163 n=1 Tax=Cacopsylla melanoneura TaxID=428564 RepID=A0A8D8U6U5_9HEMI
MNLCVSLKVLLIFGVSAVYCEKITYREAEQIFQKVLSSKEEFQDDSQSRSIFSALAGRFTSFMRDHDKVYDSEDELFQRNENFIANVDLVEDISIADRGTARYGINKFSDLSAEELQQRAGLNINWKGIRVLKDNFGSSLQEDNNRTELEKQSVNTAINWKKREPKSLDWRDKGVISKVKNQGRCSSCWAFSSVGVVEAMNAIARNDLVELSVQQLVDCDKSNDGCHGGLMDTAFDYIIKSGGVESEADYPYLGYLSEDGCQVKEGNKKKKYGMEKYTRIPQGGEEAMKKWLAQHGPLSVGINARGIFFYTGGIIALSEVGCYPKAQNHAVIVVGYGEEKKRFGKTIPYWIVRNTWGEDWGEKGYFRMKRGANICGISEFVHGVEVKNEEHETQNVNNNRNEKNTLWDYLDC